MIKFANASFSDMIELANAIYARRAVIAVSEFPKTPAGHVLGDEVSCLVHQAAARLAEEMLPALRAYDLALPSWRILAQLSVNGPMRAGRLAVRLSLDASTVSRNVERLQQRGLVERHRLGANRRATNLHLTNAGEALVTKLVPSVAAAQQPLKAAFSAAELSLLKGLLRRVPAILDEDRERSASAA